MQVDKHKVVLLDYTLKDSEGTVIDSTEGRGDFAYLHGTNNVIPGLEKTLLGRKTGDEVEVTIAPNDGYGERSDEMVQVVSKSMFDSGGDVQVGIQFYGEAPDGQNIIFTVMEVKDDDVTIDGNHPLAGVELHFALKIMDIREATEEEISHGHVHGPGGHNH